MVQWTGVRRRSIRTLLLLLLVFLLGDSRCHCLAQHYDVVTAATAMSMSRTPTAMVPKNRRGRRLRHGGGRDDNNDNPRMSIPRANPTSAVPSSSSKVMLTTTTAIDETRDDHDNTSDDNEEQPPQQQRRQLPTMDEQMMGGIILLVVVFLLLTCCCRGMLCDLLACVCLYDLCCDGPPVADIGSAAFNLC